MVTTTTPLTFSEFLEQYPDDQGRFELVDGEITERPATRRHDDIAEFLDRQFYQEVARLKLNYVGNRQGEMQKKLNSRNNMAFRNITFMILTILS